MGPRRQQASQFPGLFVIPRPLHRLAAAGQVRLELYARAPAGPLLQLLEGLLGRFAAVNARRPEKDHGVLDVLRLEATERLEILGENAKRACLFALQKRRVEVGERL